MQSRVAITINPLKSLPPVLLFTCSLLHAAAAPASDRFTSNLHTRDLHTRDTALQIAQQPSRPGPVDILVILGLNDATNELVRQAALEEFSGLNIQQVDSVEASSSDYTWPAVDYIVATGRNGCQVALQSTSSTPLLCTLLTEEIFRSLDVLKRTTGSLDLSALVIDQPISRQALVASRVYPALTQFSAFSGSGIGFLSLEEAGDIDVMPYQTEESLSDQLTEALSGHDALIATSDSDIFNVSTLSTVLLTAYGYGKPVIGFSRAYVKAGALITCYSTPALILRQVAGRLLSGSRLDAAEENLIYPEYFSVVDNPSVARSLGLIREYPIAADEIYTDADFQP